MLEKLKTMKKVDILKNVIIVLFLIILAIAICMQSELNPINNRPPTVDSDVYIFVAKLMHEGKKVYSDIFTRT